MKAVFGIVFFVFLMFGCASVPVDENRIVQRVNPKAEKEIVLVKVENDSRCPEGTQCVWAGEVTFEVAAYENKKQREQIQFTLNKNTSEEIKAWFIQNLPKNTRELKAIEVLPYPKEGVTIRPEDYYIKLVY